MHNSHETEVLLWLFHHIQLWGDNYFRKDGNPHKDNSNHTLLKNKNTGIDIGSRNRHISSEEYIIPTTALL